MDTNKLTEQEEKFCLVYACGPSPYNGNAQKTYDLVFNGATGNYRDSNSSIQAEHEVNVALETRKLMAKDDIKERIDQLLSESVVDATTLRPRLTSLLLKIADECATTEYKDKFGVKLSPAALRAVSVNAISKLTDMYGIKEDIAHKVQLEGADGEGLVFQLIVPEKNKDNELSVVG